jgi:hypothetical protein
LKEKPWDHFGLFVLGSLHEKTVERD